jgi:hypothetical protein
MKFNELSHMMQKPEPNPDTYEAGMAQNQLLKIGTHAVRLHNMIDDGQEMESWVAKKIDLASNYVKSVHGYTAGQKAGTYDDDGMSEEKQCPPGQYYCKMSGKCKPIQEDASGFKLVSQAKDIAKKMAGNLTGAVKQIEKLQKDLSKNSSVQQALAQFNEDAGEGHMSKSQLYQTAKMAIELLDMIRKGDDLEGWVQTKLNLAADYLQAVYHYEDYQKLNPYREELDGSLMQKHAGIIQKHLDEILERKCRAEDVDTKPGMMRILKKRVNEVEKEIAKENRKNTDEGDGRKSGMHPKGHPMRQKQQAAIHANEADLEEGIKDWAKNLAMAGVIVAGLAGFNSINDAIDNGVPAVKAMNTALELAQDQGNTELADMIEKDLSAVKVRLSSGKDLNFVKGMQDKYSKFVKTEGLAYESQLQIKLSQRI